MGVLAASLAQLDATTLPLQVVPALGAVLFARFTSFGITALVGLSIGVLQSLLYYASTQSWFPTDKGAALPGISSLLTFIIIVIALYVRGSSLPTRGELIEQRLPAVAAARAPRARPLPSRRSSASVALIVLPYDYRNALIISLAAMTICLSYVVITGFIGQVSLMQIALAGSVGLRRLAPLQGLRRRLPARAPSPASWRRPSWASWPAPRRCACAASAWRW